MTKYKFYLTFDVGIVNLAYCLARYDTSKSISEGLDIINWGILDVSYKPLICKHIKNKRAICNKKSIFYSLKPDISDIASTHTKSENLIGYCQIHANELKQKNKKAYSSLYRVSKNPVFTNNFNVQIERLLSALEIFYNEKIISLYHTENTKDEIFNNKQYSVNNLEILIENQPIKNPTMKSISIAMLTFFTLKKVISLNVIKSVNFISPTEKTQLPFIKTMKETLKINPKTNLNFKNYNHRKIFAVDATTQILPKINNSLFNIISSVNYELSTKKDDMADTLLYVIIMLLK
jgi:hypothetical protein